MKRSDNRMIHGVCAGIAEELGIKPIFVRLVFLFGFKYCFWPYIILDLILEDDEW